MILMLYSPRYPVNITFQGAVAKLSYFFRVLFVTSKLVFFFTFLCPHLKIILKKLFASGSVNIGEYLPRTSAR